MAIILEASTKLILRFMEDYQDTETVPNLTILKRRPLPLRFEPINYYGLDNAFEDLSAFWTGILNHNLTASKL